MAERERRGLTQVQVARGLGKPQSYVSKYERGERRLDFTEFLEVASVIGIDMADFVALYKATLGRSK